MISQFFPVIMLLTCVLGIMELNCLPRFGDKKKTIIIIIIIIIIITKICFQGLLSSTKLQNRSFHVVEGTRTPAKNSVVEFSRTGKNFSF